MNDSKINSRIDSIFYELTFAPFMAAAFFGLLALFVFIRVFDTYSVVQLGFIGIMFIIISIAGFLYWNAFNIPLIISIIGSGFLIASGYKIYSYYFLLHPIERFRSLWLFESSYSPFTVFLAKWAICTLVAIGGLYFALGMQQRKRMNSYGYC